MYRNDASAMSGLEAEFELEVDAMGGEEKTSRYESEADGGDMELDDSELEQPDEELAGPEAEYVERLLELSQREFESDSEMDGAVGEVLSDMEREYFFGSLKKLARRGLSLGAKALLNKAKGLMGGLPLAQGLSALTQLTRGNLMGSLKSLAKTGLAAALRAHPAGAAALATLQGLGFKESEAPEDNREAWETFVDVSREAYESLARNLNGETATPVGAAAQAAQALQAGLRGARRGGRRRRHRGQVLRLRRGQRITIIAE